MRMTIMASLPPTHIVWGGGIPPSAPGKGEGMGGDWKRDTFQTPLISPLPPPHNVCGGEGGHEERKIKKKLKKNYAESFYFFFMVLPSSFVME